MNKAAFQGDEEAGLVDRLRNAGAAVLSLVALEGDQIVGQIMFSDVAIKTQTGVLPAVALAPVAVLPELQRRGIGSALVRRGLEAESVGSISSWYSDIQNTIPASASQRN